MYPDHPFYNLSSDDNPYRLAMEAMRIGVWDFDAVHDLFYWDKGCRRVLSVPENLPVSWLTFFDLLHPEDLVQTRTAIIEGGDKANEHRYSLEFRIVGMLDAQVRWIRAYGKTFFDAEDRLVRSVGTVQDITEEVEGRETRQKLFTLVANNEDLMSVMALTGVNTYLNKAGMDLLGFDSMEEVASVPISQLHAPEDFAYVQQHVIPEVLRTGRWSGAMNVRHLKTGEIFPVHNNCLRIDDPNTGKPLGVGAVMRDLRRELAARQALIESEQRFRNMIGQAPVAIAVLKGRDLIIESANAGILELWGKDATVVGLPLEEGLPEIIGQGFIEMLIRVLDTGAPVYGDETLARINRNGKLGDYYFNFVYAPVVELGEITSVIVVATEITNLIMAKRQLQASEDRFRSLVLSAPMPIAVYVGREMRIQLANESVLKVWDKDASVIGRTFREALPELEGQPFHQLLDSVFMTGVSYEATEDRVDLFVNGRLQTFFFNFTYKALRDATGEIYGIINTATDVTAYVQAREELAAAQQQLRIAIDSAKMGTWRLDCRTNELAFSQRGRELYGFEEGELNIAEGILAVPEKDRERVVQRLQQALDPASGGEYEDEYTIIHLKDKTVRRLSAAGKVSFNEAGEPVTMIGTIRDITAQKLIEQELEQQVLQRTIELRNANLGLKSANLDLARVNANLEQFAYVASHDLQEPLRKIRMFAGLLQERNAPFLDEQGKIFLGKISESSERMARLIQDILNFSKISAQESLFEPTDLVQVLTAIGEDLELLIVQKQARVSYHNMPVIDAIPVQIRQLFYNLISNALKFVRPGTDPVIDISGRMLEPAEVSQYSNLHKPGPYYELRVKDNGIGFDQQFAKQIFTIFQRLHTRDKYEGTGIGLALCHTIVAHHHGEIFTESTPGTGATFYIILPQKQ